MLQGEETLKLQDFIKKKFPELKSEELEKVSNQLLALAYFLVRQQVKKQVGASASKDEEDFNQPTDKP